MRRGDRSRTRFEPRTGRYGAEHGGRWSSPWVLRAVVVVAVAVLAAALVDAALHGVLFSLPKR